MKYPCLSAALFAVLVSNTSVSAAVHYVNANNLNPSPPFSTWANAATNIQDAVDVASPGDQVIVTNGLYATGGRVKAISDYDLITGRCNVHRVLNVSCGVGPSGKWGRWIEVVGIDVMNGSRHGRVRDEDGE